MRATLQTPDEPSDVVFVDDVAVVSCVRSNLLRVLDAVSHATAPLDGGIRYAWTVNLAGNTSASCDGAIGAWGWEADGDNGTTIGRTEAAIWITPVSKYGTVFPPQRLNITRK